MMVDLMEQNLEVKKGWRTVNYLGIMMESSKV